MKIQKNRSCFNFEKKKKTPKGCDIADAFEWSVYWTLLDPQEFCMDAELNEIGSWAQRKSQKGIERFLFGFFVYLFLHEYFSEVRGDLRYYTLRFMCHDYEGHSS